MSSIPALRRWKWDLQYLLFRCIEIALGLLPRGLRARLVTSVIRAAAVFRLNRLGMANLDRAYGDSLSREEKKRILRKLYDNIGRVLVELMDYRKQGQGFVARLVENDPSILQIHRAIEQKRGVIFVTPHFGNWELLPAWATLQGFQGVLVGKKVKNPRFNERIVSMRAGAGARIVYSDESARKLIQSLRENCLLGILPDVDTTRLDGIFLPFFGRQTYTPTGPAALSVLTGAPVVPVFLVFEDGKYRFFAEPAIEPMGKERSEAEIERITRAWSEAFEKWIRKHPDHWMWFQKRWSTTPENAPVKHARRRQQAN